MFEMHTYNFSGNLFEKNRPKNFSFDLSLYVGRRNRTCKCETEMFEHTYRTSLHNIKCTQTYIRMQLDICCYEFNENVQVMCVSCGNCSDFDFRML